MKNEKSNLAIIIPYYKIGHFQELLDALSNQTNQNFNIYVGNDASPDDPQEIIDRFGSKLNITYKRFEKNLGGESLTKQWERCLELAGDEEWVWILPDDDVPSKNVVEEFYKALESQEKYNIKVIRFPLNIIDSDGHVIESTVHDDPVVETNLSFYQRIVRGQASASLGDNIFHKKSLLESDGFVDFPKAWGSDHATVLEVSSGGSIYFLEKAKLYFRKSGENISSKTTDGVEKMKARVQFAKWLKKNDHIFPSPPDLDFYKFFYWRGEYYVLNEWKFSLKLMRELYRLRKICFNSRNIFPLIKVWLQKMGLLKK